MLKITTFKTNGVSYYWQAVNITNMKESTGTGDVIDADIGKWLSIRSSYDSNEFIHVGQIKIPWSYSSPTSIWLYYTKERTHVAVVTNQQIKLLKHHRM